ncbi:unnamed protein product, partial [Ectocarpus sp. 12 AP-2014]
MISINDKPSLHHGPTKSGADWVSATAPGPLPEGQGGIDNKRRTFSNNTAATTRKRSASGIVSATRQSTLHRETTAHQHRRIHPAEKIIHFVTISLAENTCKQGQTHVPQSLNVSRRSCFPAE